MSTATSGRAREHRVRDDLLSKGWVLIARSAGSKGPAPIPRGRAPLCACGCGTRTSTVRTAYVLGHRPPRPSAERFWEKVDRKGDDECWPWLAHRHKNGYASFQVGEDHPRVMAHRYAYEQLVGPIPDGLTIARLCRNRSCCNPAHMEPVTRGENSRRGGGLEVAKAARRERAQVACPSGHPRTSEHAHRRPDGQWRCKTCRNISRAAKRAAA